MMLYRIFHSLIFFPLLIIFLVRAEQNDGREHLYYLCIAMSLYLLSPIFDWIEGKAYLKADKDPQFYFVILLKVIMVLITNSSILLLN